MSSEEALNGIFNILSVMVAGNEEKKKKTDDKTDKTLIELLQGIVDTAKEKEAGTAAGKQLEDLAKGLNAFKDIDHDVIDKVSASVENISKIFNNLKFDDNVNDNINNLISTIDSLVNVGSTLSKKLIDFIKGFQLENPEEHIKNATVIISIITALNKLASADLSKLEDTLDDLDPNIGLKLGNFIEKFISSLEKATSKINSNNIENLLKPISNLFYGLRSIVDTNIFQLKISLNPIKGYLLGRQIGQFLHAIMKRIENDHVNEDIEKLGSVLSPLATFITADIKQLKKILSTRNAKRISKFFTVLTQELPKEKETKEVMQGVSSVLETLTSISLFKIIRFNLLVASLSEEKAQKINTFIKTLTEGKFDKNKLKTVNEFMVSWNKTLSVVIAGIVIIALLATFISPIAILTGMVIIGLSMQFMKKTITSLIKEISNKKVKDAEKVINALTKLIGVTVSLIAVISLITSFIGLGPVLLGFIIINVTISNLTDMITQIAGKKLSTNLKHVTNIIKNITLLLITFVGAITILAFVTKIAKPKNIIIAMGVIALFMTGAYFMIKKLSQIDSKSLKNSTDALLKISACFAIISLVAATLLRPIAKQVGDVLIGGAVVLGILSIMIFGVYMITKIKDKKMRNAITNLALLTAIFTAISIIAIVLLPKIGEHALEAFGGAVITLGIIAALIFGVHMMTQIKDKKMRKAIMNLALLTLIYAGISLLALFILPKIGEHGLEALGGALITIGIIGSLIFGVWLISNIDVTTVGWGLLATLALAVIYTGIALMVKEILIPIGKHAVEALGGAVITGLLLLGLILGVKELSLIHINRDIVKALIVTVALAVIYTGIALIIKEILIPIGEKAKEALYGAGITVLVIGALTAIVIGLGYLMKIKGLRRVMAEGAVVLAALGALMWELGKASEAFAKGAYMLYSLNGGGPLKGGPIEMGGLLMVEILGAIGLIVGAIGFLMKKFPNLKKYLLYGSIVAAAICMVADILAGEFYLYSLAMSKIAKMGLQDILDASLLMGEVFGVIGLSITAIGAIASIPGVAEFAAIGAIVATAIGVVVNLLGLEFLAYSKTSKEIFNLNKNGEVVKGSDTIVEILKSLSGIIWQLVKMSALSIPAAGAGVAVLFLTPIIGGLSLTIIPGYIKMFKLLQNYDNKQLLDVSEKIITIVTELKKIIEHIQKIDNTVTTAAKAKLVSSIFNSLSYIVDKIQEINGKISVEDMQNFKNVIIGKDEKDVNSLLGCIKAIVQGFNDLGVWASAVASLISKVIRPIIDTVSMWIDVILKVSTMSYVTGYDDNGKPMYEHLPPNVFKDAATAVSTGFKEFLQSLNEGFKGLGPISGTIMSMTAKSIEPIINTISKWIDVIMKVATGTYITGYDDNGKPMYEHLDPKDFSEAAHAVTIRFQEFLQSLNKGLEGLSVNALITMDCIKNTIGPVMESVGSFVDAVIKVATMQIVTGYDENGHPEYQQIDEQEFLNAGVVLAETFKHFMEGLSKAFNELSPWAVIAIKSIGSSMGPLMDGVSKFVDAILKLASGQYIDSYTTDEKGNQIPHFTKIEPEQYTVAADTIATYFGKFVDGITANFSGGFWYSKTENALEALASNLGPIMDAVSKYVDAILMLATGTYVDHMEKDKDGKLQPYYKQIPKDAFKNAATEVADSFVQFVNKLIEEFNKGDLIEKAKKLEDMMKDSISPIMDAVKNYSDALKPFLSMTSNKPEDRIKKEDYLCLDPSFINDISTNIATSFTTFISKIVTEFTKEENKKRYEDIAGISKNIEKALGHIKKAITSYSEIAKMIIPKEGEENQGNPIIEAQNYADDLTKGMKAILDAVIFYDNDKLKEISNTSKLLQSAFQITKTSVDKYKTILDTLTSIDNDENRKKSTNELITGFLTDITTLLDGFNNLSFNIEISSELSTLQVLLGQYITIASLCKELNDIMSNTRGFTEGINSFIRNLKVLTSTEISKRMSSNTGSLRTYTARLSEFTKQVKHTTKYVQIYVTGLNKAKEALKSLDKQIIDKANKRNKALQDLADKINAIAAAVDNMRGAFESLDENSIISKFENVKSMLDAANLSQNTQAGNNTKNNGTGSSSTRPTPQRSGSQSISPMSSPRNNVSYNNYNSGNNRTTGTVIFYFQNGGQMMGTYEKR